MVPREAFLPLGYLLKNQRLTSPILIGKQNIKKNSSLDLICRIWKTSWMCNQGQRHFHWWTGNFSFCCSLYNYSGGQILLWEFVLFHFHSWIFGLLIGKIKCFELVTSDNDCLNDTYFQPLFLLFISIVSLLFLWRNFELFWCFTILTLFSAGDRKRAGWWEENNEDDSADTPSDRKNDYVNNDDRALLKVSFHSFLFSENEYHMIY